EPTRRPAVFAAPTLAVVAASLLAPPPEGLPPGAVARFGTLKLRHASYVAAVAFSPDGRLLASGSHTNYGGTDGSVRVWDAATGAPRWRAEHEATALAWAPDGSVVASAGRDGTIRV